MAALLCVERPAHADVSGVERWRALIGAASRTFDIPESWIASVMHVESAGMETLDGKPITSPKGAMGLMQIMPTTWNGLRDRYGLGNDPYDPHDNIFAGAAYLRELYQHYGYPNLFAAYNAGPGRLDAHLARGISLPNETELYLLKAGLEQETVPAAGRRLFFTLSQRGLRGTGSQTGRLFIALRTASTAR